MVGSGVGVKGGVVGVAVWPKLSGVEVKGCTALVFIFILYFSSCHCFAYTLYL